MASTLRGQGPRGTGNTEARLGLRKRHGHSAGQGTAESWLELDLRHVEWLAATNLDPWVGELRGAEVEGVSVRQV